MYWLRRPPYLRYVAAALLLLGAATLELLPSRTVLHPFAARDLAPGVGLAEAAVEWRQVPVGVLPPVAADQIVRRPVAAGNPVLPADLGGALPRAPDGWWGLEVALPARVQPGQSVQLVVMGELGAESVPGLVLEAGGGGDPFGLGDVPGVVAVPPEQAVPIAMAAAEGRLAVLIEP